jgi:catabolite repression HPr-like protein
MLREKIKVNKKNGLQSRTALSFVQEANHFKSEILIEKDIGRLNAKSIMGLMSLAIVSGTEIILEASGPDEKEAIERLKNWLGN